MRNERDVVKEFETNNVTVVDSVVTLKYTQGIVQVYGDCEDDKNVLLVQFTTDELMERTLEVEEDGYFDLLGGHMYTFRLNSKEVRDFLNTL